MPFHQEHEAIEYIFRSRRKLDGVDRGRDEVSRDPTPTRHLLAALGLPHTEREYAVITGSRGKGSTTAIMAKILQYLGHTVGMISGPHLRRWYERIRINGRCIPQEDFFRILSDMQPAIDQIESQFTGRQYLSPQGIFLAIALRWFDEQNADAAVLEVGRGGRFDDIAVVPNKLALITPIVMEHVQYLGPTLDRIAWHKAGIIKQHSFVYSVPQAPEVLAVLQKEADMQDAEFYWLGGEDMGEYLGDTDDGIRMRLGRYGELTVSLFGRYQVQNVTLAVQGAGNMHGRLHGISHGDPEYVLRVHAALSNVRWPGRCEKLQDRPAVYVDAAITPDSAQLFVDSVRSQLKEPVVSIVGVPIDRDYRAVYKVMAEISDALIITETDINPNTHFPDQAAAIAAAETYHNTVHYAARLPEALDIAKSITGETGTILMAVSQMLVGESMIIWNQSLEEI